MGHQTKWIVGIDPVKVRVLGMQASQWIPKEATVEQDESPLLRFGIAEVVARYGFDAGVTREEVKQV